MRGKYARHLLHRPHQKLGNKGRPETGPLEDYRDHEEEVEMLWLRFPLHPTRYHQR